ncbi:hypothetical protein NPIRD3C_0418 [Nitrosopumilus piranensis]|uniref:Uncharacterized protein n=1 Tax=Nitrosopumilus piranensis TaxID=1582439 RepID=A0A0C5BTY0_9ARCH|nr:hypothetical protein NPIRD3C_0418 [Nitrosopumilus piranensis]
MVGLISIKTTLDNNKMVHFAIVPTVYPFIVILLMILNESCSCTIQSIN